MRKHTVRLYAAAATLLAFFALWTAIAAKPWATAKPPTADPRLATLAAREHRLRAESAAVKRLVAHRWQVYERRLRARRHQIAAAERRHAQQLAAAQLAAQRIAAARAFASRTVAAAAPAVSAPVASPGPSPAPRVVTLPPRVQIVALPPVTSSSSS